jgi:hypothetical protein
MAPTGVFPLRFRSMQLRALVRELAAHENISQNEFIEQAVEHEAVLRGGMLSDDLAAASRSLAMLTNAQHNDQMQRAITTLAAGEELRDPLQATALHTGAVGNEAPSDDDDKFGVLAAFESARR